MNNLFKIALKADNGLWVSRFSYNDNEKNYMRACKSSIDECCILTMHQLNASEIALSVEGLYIKRYTIATSDPQKKNLIMAVEGAGIDDECCRFIGSYVRDGVIVLKADNGCYLTRMTYNDKLSHLIVANKEHIDEACEFTVKHIIK